MNMIEIRKFLESDVETFSNLILTTWEIDSYGKSVAYPISEMYLRDCISDSDIKLTAVSDGVPVGCAFAKSLENQSSHTKTPYSDGLPDDPGFSIFINDIQIIDRVYSDLLSRSDEEFDSQLVLLIVDDKQRGFGIGRTLFDEISKELASQVHRRMLIFTDDDCGYGFYDHLGCRKVNHQEIEIAFENLDVMMYSYELRIPPERSIQS